MFCDHLGWRRGFGPQVPVLALLLSVSSFAVPSFLRAPFSLHSDASLWWARLAYLDVCGCVSLAIGVGTVLPALEYVKTTPS